MHKDDFVMIELFTTYRKSKFCYISKCHFIIHFHKSLLFHDFLLHISGTFVFVLGHILIILSSTILKN